MQPQQKTSHLSVRLPEWLIEEVDLMANSQNRTRSNMLETLLRERFGKQKREKIRP